ncbi:MAG TPA: hypothetical protein DCL42_04390 [Deltaproteobacteria bacterium]|nr:hypothetical protein [Deltaproteobacteria bacterium]
MNDTALAIFAGAMEGLGMAQKNKLILEEARMKLDQDKEIFGIDKKIKELQLKKHEFDLGPEQIKAEKEKLKAETAAKNAVYALSLMKIESATKEEDRKAEEHTKAMTLADKILSNQLDLQPGQRIDIGSVSAGQSVGRNNGSSYVNPWEMKPARGQAGALPKTNSLTDEDLALLD